MNLLEAINWLQSWPKRLAQSQAEDALTAALDYKALVQFRIQSQGLNSDLQPFPGYTDDYSIYRQEAGRQTGHFDMTFRGEYWRDVKPQLTAQSFLKVVVVLGPVRRENKLKAAGQVKKRGNILVATEEEIRIVAGNYLNYRFKRLIP